MIFNESYKTGEQLRFEHNLHNGKKRVIENLAPFLSGKTVLEFGCGNGYYTRILAQSALKVYGYDFPEVLENARVLNPVSNVVYTDSLKDSYDVIIFNDSLEFNSNWKEMLDDLKNKAHTVYIISPNFDMRKLPWAILKLAGLYARVFDRARQKTQNNIQQMEKGQSGHEKYVDTFSPWYKKAHYFNMQSNPILDLFTGTRF